jgi:hypothetical protein
VTRTEDTETRGYRWSGERSMLASAGVEGGSTGSERSERVSTSRTRVTTVSLHHVAYFISHFFSLLHYSTTIYSIYILIPSANKKVSTANSTDGSTEKNKHCATSDSPLTHHTHLAQWRILHKCENPDSMQGPSFGGAGASIYQGYLPRKKEIEQKKVAGDTYQKK